MALPWTMMGPPSPSRRARTSSRLRSTDVLCHSGFSSVVETTYFGISLYSAKSSIVGQMGANSS